MTIHRSVLKQKNKPFKNSKTRKPKAKPSSFSPKVAISPGRKAKKHQIIAKNKARRLNLQEESPRNVLVVPFHANADPRDFIASLLRIYFPALTHKSKFTPDGWYLSHPVLLDSSATHDGIPRRLLFYTCPRNLPDILYCASSADILLCLFRGSSTTEPAYDEYKILSALRLQGVPTPVGVNLEAGLDGDRQASSTLVRRYFHSEKFASVFVEKDIPTVLSLLGCVSTPQLSWRKDRGYMLSVSQSYDPSSKELRVEGYAKGLGFSVKHPVHLTAVGDYILKRIEVVPDLCPTASSAFRMAVESTVEEQDPESLAQLVSEVECLNEVAAGAADDLKDVTDEVFDAFTSKLTINRIPLAGDVEMDEKSELDYDLDGDAGAQFDCDSGDDASIASDGSDGLELEDVEAASDRPKKIEFEPRTLEELSFPDEVDTPVDVPARERLAASTRRFRKYRSLKNLRSSAWDPYESLPLEYFKINEFENFRVGRAHPQATMKASKAQLAKNCQAPNVAGSFVRLTLLNVAAEDLARLSPGGPAGRPLVVSTILPFERKVSVVNFSVSRTADGPDALPSKTPAALFCGFRRYARVTRSFPAVPIFSRSVNAERGKRGLYARFFAKGDSVVATVYGMSLCPPAPVLALGEGRPRAASGEAVLFGGHVVGSEPSRVIVKRILLTGYPMKVHKRRAIVRYMFFDPADVKWVFGKRRYFKPVALFTKRGLRGRILQSLGTHGHMKCLFSDFIAQDDIVCLPLYKRVFPRWFPATWTRQA